jgi:hypothetical protein
LQFGIVAGANFGGRRSGGREHACSRGQWERDQVLLVCLVPAITRFPLAVEGTALVR